jgi:hypothetical protein
MPVVDIGLPRYDVGEIEVAKLKEFLIQSCSFLRVFLTIEVVLIDERPNSSKLQGRLVAIRRE